MNFNSCTRMICKCSDVITILIQTALDHLIIPLAFDYVRCNVIIGFMVFDYRFIHEDFYYFYIFKILSRNAKSLCKFSPNYLVYRKR